jgi:cyanophycinase-like exopeptidase
VLGPQRRPTVDRVLESLDVPGPVALVTAGWQEREGDDAELVSLTGGRGVNLRLHARWLEVLQRDDEYARAEREHRALLDDLQQLYLLRLDHALQAVYAMARRPGGHPRTRRMAVEDALAMVRLLDETHLARVRELHDEFYAAWRLEERAEVARHREEVRAVLAAADCLLIAGGHVAELLHVLHVFHLAPHLPRRVVAWSAGAMALTSRVVLFGDRAAQGPAHSEVYDAGLGVIPGLVLLPHARRRLRTDDLGRMSVLARRFAPASCLVLDDGIRVDLGADGDLPPGARVVDADGRIGAVGRA